MMEPDTAIEDIRKIVRQLLPLMAQGVREPAVAEQMNRHTKLLHDQAVLAINTLINERVVAELEAILEAPGRTAYNVEEAAEKRLAELKGEV